MRKRLTDSVSVEELIQMYENGMNPSDISNSLGGFQGNGIPLFAGLYRRPRWQMRQKHPRP